jgi:hypothetical protein
MDSEAERASSAAIITNDIFMVGILRMLRGGSDVVTKRLEHRLNPR